MPDDQIGNIFNNSNNKKILTIYLTVINMLSKFQDMQKKAPQKTKRIKTKRTANAKANTKDVS